MSRKKREIGSLNSRTTTITSCKLFFVWNLYIAEYKFLCHIHVLVISVYWKFV